MVSGQFYCHSQAFAVNFLAAGAGCQGPAVAAPRRMSLQVPLREMTTAEAVGVIGVIGVMSHGKD